MKSCDDIILSKWKTKRRRPCPLLSQAVLSCASMDGAGLDKQLIKNWTDLTFLSHCWPSLAWCWTCRRDCREGPSYLVHKTQRKRSEQRTIFSCCVVRCHHCHLVAKLGKAKTTCIAASNGTKIYRALCHNKSKTENWDLIKVHLVNFRLPSCWLSE